MPATSDVHHGSVASGDVELFFRRFGERGGSPLLILHGANYYDSRDWVEVAAALASDREVVSYDARGYGLSGWSPSQDYSLDAQLADITAVLDHLGWERAILVGHSRGGSFTLRYAYEKPDRVAGVALVDFSPGHTPGRPDVQPPSVGSFGPVYASLQEAHAATSRHDRELETEVGRARAESIFGQRDGGWVNVRRDPAFASDRPIDKPDWSSVLTRLDLWEALESLVAGGTPTQVIRGTKSPVYDEAALARLSLDFPQTLLTEVESGHDVPGAAPAELVSAIRTFIS